MKKIEAIMVLGIVALITFPFFLIYFVSVFLAELVILIKEMFFEEDAEYEYAVLTTVIKVYINKFKNKYKEFVE